MKVLLLCEACELRRFGWRLVCLCALGLSIGVLYKM